MSFVIKNPLINLVVSIVNADEDSFFILATNFKRYFIEKDVTKEIFDDRLTEINDVKFPLKKVLEALTQSVPSKSSIEFEDDCLRIEVELTITISKDKSEKLKVYFNMTECTSIEEVSKYFMNGLVKSVIEQSSSLKVSLPDAAFQLSPSFIEIFGKEVSNMLDAKSEKDLTQGLLHAKSSDSVSSRKLKKHKSQQMLVKQPPIEKKKFEYKEDSQELFLSEDTSTLTQSSSIASSQAPSKLRKRKNPTLKF